MKSVLCKTRKREAAFQDARFFLFFLLLSAASSVKGQRVEGYVKDESTNAPLALSSVRVAEWNRVFACDTNGRFFIPSMRRGSYHIIVSHVGSEERSYYVFISGDTSLVFALHYDETRLSAITVHANRISDIHNTISVSSAVIKREGGKDISDILSHLPGVYVLRTNVGISKPIVDGLYGNRVDILNNGALQSGQLWGNDHAPEIDPFTAHEIKIIKGIHTLEHSAGIVGSILQVEQSPIYKDEHWHGEVNYLLNSNNYGHTFNAQTRRYNAIIPFRVNATYKRSGDSRSPDYWLTNTGKRETDFSVFFEKEIRKWNLSLYYSLFSTEVGILRGSHISNLTDLEEAIHRQVPFFTKSAFSYDIAPPRQEVFHHLLRWKSDYALDSQNSFQFAYSLQINDRKEFDIRRGGRSGIPALSIFQSTQQGGITYKHRFARARITTKTGVQLRYIFNQNDLSTNVLPLIPDYTALQPMAFFTAERKANKLSYGLGLRYEYIDLQAFQFLPRQNTRSRSHRFGNYNITANAQYDFDKNNYIDFQTTFAYRSPAINELYSFGLHQGVSGIEEGNSELRAEEGIKFILSGSFLITPKLKLYATSYYQRINDYIYLQPQPEFRLTIRGAFPVYTYQQADAVIYGGSLLVNYQPIRHWEVELKAPIVRGQNIGKGIPLVYMPSDRIMVLLGHQFTSENSERFYIKLSGAYEYIYKQYRLLAEQDFLSPPDSYGLLSLKVESHFYIGNRQIEINLALNNVLNSRYRDYLNRLRYFSDEPGISASLHAQFTF